MKYLFYGGSSILMPHMGVLLNEALSLERKGHEIVWTYCNAKCQSCISNMSSNPIICKNCLNRTRRLLRKYSDKLTVIGLIDKKACIEKVENNYLFNDIDELKKFTFQECNLGYSIASTYISATRNSIMSFSDQHKKYYSVLAMQTIERFLHFEKVVKISRPDCIIVFNGRYFDTAVCVAIAKKYHIDYQIKEVLDGPRCNQPFFIETFFDCSAFDITNKTTRINESWNLSQLSDSEKNKIGTMFYERKRSGESVNDKSYVKQQQIGVLPEKWNVKMKNIVIFNSSDDELASIGADYDSYSLFTSQYIGITSILEKFKEERGVYFYLRMHPNLSGLNNPFVNGLLGLADKFDNVTVIAPTEIISTYTLLDAADKVISFGSTMGVEANYWGKPSILLSASGYYHLGICYIPSSEHELYEMIKSDLVPLDKMGAIKYAFYLLERDVRCHRATIVDISFTKQKILGKYIYIFSYDKLFQSSMLSRLESLIYRKVFSKLVSDKNKFPERLVLDNV